MKKTFKKLSGLILAATLVTSSVVPAFAEGVEPQVLATFICGGIVEGKSVPRGSSVTAPEVPVIAGHTFCGFDKSLYNLEGNTFITAVYVPTEAGPAAIEAMKASLPTPAVSETSVADPNAVPVETPVEAAPVVNTLLQNQQAALASLKAAQAAAAAAAEQAANVNKKQEELQSEAERIAAEQKAEAERLAAEQAKAAEQALAEQNQAAAEGAQVPFTDKNGNSYTFSAHEWETLMRVYGTEEILREHLLGDLIRVAEYFG